MIGEVTHLLLLCSLPSCVWRGTGRTQDSWRQAERETITNAPLSPPKCEPVWPSGKALGWWAEGPRFESASALSSLQTLWSVDTGLWLCPSQLMKLACDFVPHNWWNWLVTLSLTIDETLKCLSLLPILMQESFWWWQCSDRYIISLFAPLRIPSPNNPYGFCGH